MYHKNRLKRLSSMTKKWCASQSQATHFIYAFLSCEVFLLSMRRYSHHFPHSCVTLLLLKWCRKKQTVYPLEIAQWLSSHREWFCVLWHNVVAHLIIVHMLHIITDHWQERRWQPKCRHQRTPINSLSLYLGESIWRHSFDFD